MLVWLSVWSEVQIVCIWSSWCHCRPQTLSSLASFKSRLVLPFCYRLTQAVLEKRPLNGYSSLFTPLTSLCWASSIGSQHDATRICCWAPAPGMPPLLTIDGTKQTDERTPDRYLDPALHTMRAASMMHDLANPYQAWNKMHKESCEITYLVPNIRPLQRNHCVINITTPWVKKTRHLSLAHNFTKYWPIFKILSLLDSVENL